MALARTPPIRFSHAGDVRRCPADRVAQAGPQCEQRKGVGRRSFQKAVYRAERGSALPDRGGAGTTRLLPAARFVAILGFFALPVWRPGRPGDIGGRPDRPDRPGNRPGARPDRPDARPDRPGDRQGDRPCVRPDSPGDRPAARPVRPQARPDRPQARPDRPQARPQQSRPNRPQQSRPQQSRPNRPNAAKVKIP